VAKSKIKKIIKFLEDGLKSSHVNISKIVLFGSRATGKASSESDIDIIVVSADFHGKDIFERVRMIRDAEVTTIRKFMVPLDIVALTPEEFESGTSLISDYARGGEVVYAA
jgi:predicted nucleotidyltransferase